jgi:hypothetical protein
MHWRRLRPCPSPCNPAYEIGRCQGRSIDKGRIIGLDSSNLSKPPKLCLATGLWRIQRWYLAGSGNGPLHRAAARTSSDTAFQEEYLAFLKKHGAHFDEKYLWISCARSYRTLRDGSFEGRFPGTPCQATIGVSLRDALADISQQHLTKYPSLCPFLIVPPPELSSVPTGRIGRSGLLRRRGCRCRAGNDKPRCHGRRRHRE